MRAGGFVKLTWARHSALVGLAGALLLLVVSHSRAAMLCSEPIEPVCVGIERTYESESLKNRCKADVNDYLSKVEDYVSCLREEAKEKEKQANELKEKFDSEDSN